MKIKQTVHVHHQKYEWEDQSEYIIYTHKFDDTDFRVHICECEIEIEVPDEFDPRAQQIAALEQQKQKAMAEYQNTLTEINERISRLQAISHDFF
jgi:GH35 family endo-1,4-beta-xylanase